MSSADVSRWSRAFVAAGVCFFVAWQAAAVAGYGRRVTVALGLYGFVFHVVFGKAYALVPSYFERELAVPRAMALHFALAVLGVGGLVAGALGVGPSAVGSAGAAAWSLGCLVFVGALGWTVRDNPTGAETGTGDVNAHRRRTDRAANAFVPVVILYVLAGAALLVLERGPDSLVRGLEAGAAIGVDVGIGGPAVSHLFAAGAGTLLVFAIGFRLLPRFLVVTPRPALVALVLPAGAVAPALLAADFLGGVAFRLGATLQAIAVVGFAIAYADMYRRTDRDRVGFHAVLLGTLCGIGAIALGLHIAFAGFNPAVVEAHYRLALAGFLGLTIVGVSYQFYPPAIGTTFGVGDRSALLAAGLLFAGLVLEAAGAIGDLPSLAAGGTLVGFAGAVLYAFVVLSLFLEQR